MNRPQRRQKFVDSTVQGALARRVLLHWLVFFAVASIAALLLQILSDPLQPTDDHLQNVWHDHGPFLVVMVFLLPVFVMDTIKISHRFAGPICSIRRAMQEVADGQPPRKLKFREDDFWHDLANDYNAMVARLTEAEGKSTEAKQDSSAVAAK